MTITKKREALKRLPPHLDGAFQEVLTRIDSKDEARRKLAYDTMKWVLYAARPLTSFELREALSVEIRSTSIDPNNRCSVKEIVQSCAGLIMIDSGGDTVRFAHYSVQQWLQSLLPVSSNIHLASTCLTYLCFNEFDAETLPEPDSFRDYLGEHPLLDYAASHWTTHVKGYENDQDLLFLLMKLFGEEERFETMRKVRYARNRVGDWSFDSYPSFSSPAHLLAREGLAIEPPEGWENSLFDIDEYGRIPLHEACIGQHAVMIRKLLELKPNSVNMADDEGATALHFAAETGNNAIIDILIDAGANLWQMDSYNYNSFQRAVFSGEESASKKLLKKMFDVSENVSLEGPLGFTLLHQAAALGYEEGVTWLLRVGGANGYAETDTVSDTPLHRAASGGHVKVIKILLECVDITKISKDCYGNLPLHNAAKFGREEAVNILVSANASDLYARDNIGFTPLHWAAAGGHIAVVRQLLPIMDITFPSEVRVPSPYHLALWGNNHEVIVYLAHYYKVSYPRVSVFTRELFYALTDGYICQSKGNPPSIEYLAFLCRYFGLWHIIRDNFKAASIWFDLDWVVSNDERMQGRSGTTFCNRCTTAYRE